MPTWSLGRLWYYWSFHPSTTPQIMVRNQQHCSILDSIISLLSILHCQHHNFKSSPFQLLYSQSSDLGPLLFIFFTQLHLATSFLSHQSITSSILMTLSSSFLFSMQLPTKHSTPTKHHFWNLVWMASNFLSLTSSKTEFLLIGLPTQLAKIDNPSLSMPSSTSIKPVASARNLGVIFLITYISSQNPALLTFVILDVFAIL